MVDEFGNCSQQDYSQGPKGLDHATGQGAVFGGEQLHDHGVADTLETLKKVSILFRFKFYLRNYFTSWMVNFRIHSKVFSPFNKVIHDFYLDKNALDESESHENDQPPDEMDGYADGALGVQA